MKAKTNRDWYWSIPRFNRSHWWQADKHKKGVTPTAAWYELLRRHPQLEKPLTVITKERATRLKATNVATTWVAEQNLRLLYGPAPLPVTLLNILAVIGKTNWLKLSEADKTAFARALEKTPFTKARTRKADVRVIVDPTSPIFQGKIKKEESEEKEFILPKFLRNEARNFAEDLLHRAFSSNLLHPFEPLSRTGSPNWFPSIYNAIIGRRVVFAVELETDDPHETAKHLASEYRRLQRAAKKQGARPPTRFNRWLGTIARYEASELKRQTEFLENPKIGKKSDNEKVRKAFQSLFKGIHFQ